MPPNILIFLAILIGGIWFLRKLGRASQGAARGMMQKGAGVAIMGFAGLLALRGAMNIAIPVFIFGLGLAGKGAAFPNGFPWGQKSAGQKSRVNTSKLSMELDHDSGGMDGEVLAGPFKNKRLSQLSADELKAFHVECRTAGDQSQSLLEAWLDRTQGEWRETWGQGRSTASPGSGAMSKDEAYAVLGLKKGASPEDIRAAHKRLMKDFHPDKGGSDYLASKINAAKDMLLG
jgi:DnaJ domain